MAEFSQRACWFVNRKTFRNLFFRMIELEGDDALASTAHLALNEKKGRTRRYLDAG
jgi:hypothetical protein